MCVAVSLIKIGAPVFAVAIFGAVPNSQSAYAQNRGVGNFAVSSGSFNGHPGFAQNRSFGNFRTFGGSLAEDLTAAVATSDQMLWSYRA